MDKQLDNKMSMRMGITFRASRDGFGGYTSTKMDKSRARIANQ